MAKQKTFDLARLTQANVAWLIQRPASWLRERSDLFSRNADGTYDGRQVFSVMAEQLGRLVISADELSELAAYARDPANCEVCIAGQPCEFHGPSSGTQR